MTHLLKLTLWAKGEGCGTPVIAMLPFEYAGTDPQASMTFQSALGTEGHLELASALHDNEAHRQTLAAMSSGILVACQQFVQSKGGEMVGIDTRILVDRALEDLLSLWLNPDTTGR